MLLVRLLSCRAAVALDRLGDRLVEGLERQLAAFVADNDLKRWVWWLVAGEEGQWGGGGV